MATKAEISLLLDWLIGLRLPRAPKIDSPASLEFLKGQWGEAFKNVPECLIKDIIPTLRDTLRHFPTIPEIKDAIQLFPKDKMQSVKSSQAGTSYDNWRGDWIYPGFTVASDETLRALRDPKNRVGGGELDSICMKTGQIRDNKGRPAGNINEYRPKMLDKRPDLPKFLDKFKNVNDLAAGLASEISPIEKGVLDDLGF